MQSVALAAVSAYRCEKRRLSLSWSASTARFASPEEAEGEATSSTAEEEEEKRRKKERTCLNKVARSATSMRGIESDETSES